jgi:glycosyltransferase involved in cell wall biosynthesis
MRRLAIVEYVMSAGGVERVVRGLARAFVELPEARQWDITFLLARYNSSHHRVEWPADLAGPHIHLEWLGERSWASRLLGRMVRREALWSLPIVRTVGSSVARLLRRRGPRTWRAWLGDTESEIARASHRFDLLCFTYPVGSGVPPIGPPVVTIPQDFNFKHFFGEEDPWRRLQERVTLEWLARSDRVLLTTDAVAEEMGRFYPEYRHKVTVIRLGVECKRAPLPVEALETVRRKWHLPKSFLLVAGWVVAHKNQLVIVEAMKVLRQRGIAVPVVFVGPNSWSLGGPSHSGLPGGYAGKVLAALRDAGFEAGRDFHALGFVSDEEMRALFQLATVYVLPSLYEGFGLPTLEALLAGCPTVMASIPPLQEQNRLLGGSVPMFDPNDSRALANHLARTIEHEQDARKEARTAGERVASVYDWKKTARAYLATFAEVIDRNAMTR